MKMTNAEYETWKNQYDKEIENTKPVELCRTTQKRKVRRGSAGRNYYGELRRFRGYRGPLTN
jgi:hypothetical protein